MKTGVRLSGTGRTRPVDLSVETAKCSVPFIRYRAYRLRSDKGLLSLFLPHPFSFSRPGKDIEPHHSRAAERPGGIFHTGFFIGGRIFIEQ